MQQLFYQVHMRQHHPATTVSFELELIEGLAFAFVVGQELQVVIPFVADVFAAGETANRYNHWKGKVVVRKKAEKRDLVSFLPPSPTVSLVE